MFHTATTPLTVRLRRGELLAWQPARATRLRVLCGMAWVTHPDDAEDHFLQPGTSLALPRGARTLIGAEVDVTLSVSAEPGWFAWTRAAAWRRLRALNRARPAAPGRALV